MDGVTRLILTMPKNFLLLLGGGTGPLWNHLETEHPELYKQLLAAKGNKDLRHSKYQDASGCIVARHSKDSDAYWIQNVIMLKMIQDRKLPLSFGENDSVREYVMTLDPKGRPMKARRHTTNKSIFKRLEACYPSRCDGRKCTVCCGVLYGSLLLSHLPSLRMFGLS